MTKVLLDTNVILDVLLERKPHTAASAAVWAAIETGKAEGLLAAHAVAAVHYLVSRERGRAIGERTLSSILKVLGVAPVDSNVIRDAIALGWPDFEDAVTAATAAQAGCHFIVTRLPRGFPRSPVTVLPPEAAAAFMGGGR